MIIVVIIVFIIFSLITSVSFSYIYDDAKKPEKIMISDSNEHGAMIQRLNTYVHKQECMKTGDVTSCFDITRKKGTNLVNTEYIDITVTPIYKYLYSNQIYKIVYRCRFDPTELEENDIILFDDGAQVPDIFTLNRKNGTIDMTFHSKLKKVNFHMYPFVRSLSIQNIVIDTESIQEEFKNI